MVSFTMMQLTTFILILTLLTVHADTQFPMLENSRFQFDLSSRYSTKGSSVVQNFAGIDLNTVFNNGHTDWGSLTLQPFLYRIDSQNNHPPFHDDTHDWEFIMRTAAFTYTGLGFDRPWIKIGHFEIPFGLEHTKNTFGDLHQYSQVSKLGQKIDWGLSVGQEFQKWQYEIALLRGSGLKYRDRKSPYAVSGRIATLDDGQWSAGLSFYNGKILERKHIITRKIGAVDFQYYSGTSGILVEIYGGKINRNSLSGSLIELNWTTIDEEFELYFQFEKKILDGKVLRKLVSGLEYRASSSVILSTQISREFQKSNDWLFEFQLRYLL